MKRKENIDSNLVCVAEISGAHGIKGMVKLRIFTEDPADIENYMPLCDSSGKTEFTFTKIAPHKKDFLATLEGCNDRNKAEELARTKLYTHKDKLPEIEDEDTFYYSDLIDLAALDAEGNEVGVIVNVVDFGAGELLEILHKEKKKKFYLQFQQEYVPTVDIEGKSVTVNIPEGLV